MKYTNRLAYKAYKLQLSQQRESLGFAQRSLSIQHPDLNHPYKVETSFKHSGNIGDIIYSLPTVFELAKNGKAHLYLQTGQPAVYEKDFHPLGNTTLNDKMVQMLKPLLLRQPKIATLETYNGLPIDYDLDLFRTYSFSLDNGNITHWYFNVFGIYYDTSVPWLIAPKDEQYSDTIVIARSHRYRSPMVNYSFLAKYPNKIFIGVKEEFDDMRESIPDLVHKPVNDFLEMAIIINSCRLFIGNQSFPFSLAEALKARRLLEVYHKAPNVIVQGKNGSDFMYQPQFEYAVKRLLNEG